MISRILRGIAIGMADPIPGVSGGTIAYITGLYDQIIDRVSRFRSHPDGWVRNLMFILPIVVGVLLGIFLFTHLIDWLLEHFPNMTLQGFVGLVVGSLLVMINQGKLSLKGRDGSLSLTVAAALALLFMIIPRPELTDPIRSPTFAEAVLIFVAGAAAAAAMILPGVSGSLVQLIMGTYSTYIAAIKDINVVVLGIYVGGAVFGLVCMAKAIGYLFRRFFAPTQAVIGGLVIGSVVVLWPWQLTTAGHLKGLVVAILCALIPLGVQRLRIRA